MREFKVLIKWLISISSRPDIINWDCHFLFRLRYFPVFIDPEEASAIYDTLYHELPWRQRTDVKKTGESFLQPRLTAWYGDVPYSYSGLTHDSCPQVGALFSRRPDILAFLLAVYWCQLENAGVLNQDTKVHLKEEIFLKNLMFNNFYSLKKTQTQYTTSSNFVYKFRLECLLYCNVRTFSFVIRAILFLVAPHSADVEGSPRGSDRHPLQLDAG